MSNQQERQDKMDDDVTLIQDVMTDGAELVGAAVGGLLGFLATGGLGAVFGSASGVAIAKCAKYAIADVASRSLSHRERIRVGAAAAIAIIEIKQRLDNGDLPRNDDFFDPTTSDRSNADEILESVLLKSKNEAQEKKVRYLGHFYANISFEPSISISSIHHMLTIGDRLTYRQFCILAVLIGKNENRIHISRSTDYRDNISTHLETISVLQEILDLDKLGLLGCKNDDGTYHALLGWDDITPSRLVLTDFGKNFANLFALGSIPDSEFDGILALLDSAQIEQTPGKYLDGGTF